MEDLGISPWQIQQQNTINDIYNKSRKSFRKLIGRFSLKTRLLHTQTEEDYDYKNKKNKFNISLIHKKRQSCSTHQSYNDQKLSIMHSKLQIKLVPYPISQKTKLKQIAQRLSQKINNPFKLHQHKQFEVIQSKLDAHTKINTIFKQKQFLKYQYSSGKSNIKFNTIKKEDFKLKKNYTNKKQFNKIKQKKQQLEILQKNIKQKDQHLLDLIYQNKLNIQKNSQNLFYSFQKFKKHQHICNTHYSNYEQKSFTKNSLSQKKQVQELFSAQKKQKKSKQLNYKNSITIEKLDSINCFKDNTNVLLDIKNKNKTLFNQLQKYNLFGLRNYSKKNFLKS